MIITAYEQHRATRAPDQQVADLESARPLLVRTILGALTACTNPDSTCDLNASLSTSRQRLISAAISDLEDLDNQIHAARNPMNPKRLLGIPVRLHEASIALPVACC